MTQTPPPGYHPLPPQQYGDRAEVRKVGGIAKILTSLLVAAGVTSLASGAASFLRARDIEAYLEDGGSTAALSNADSAVAAAGIADLLVFLATAVYFLVWSWRVFKNAKVIEPHVAPAAGWSIGAWFIPVANLVLPGYFLSRVDRISGSNGRKAQPLIVTWAVLFGIANVLSRVIWRTPDDSLDSLLAADRRDIWTQLIFAAAAIVGALMVRAMTARQERALVDRHERLQASYASREAAARAVQPTYNAPIDPTVGRGTPRPPDDPPPPGYPETGDRPR